MSMAMQPSPTLLTKIARAMAMMEAILSPQCTQHHVAEFCEMKEDPEVDAWLEQMRQMGVITRVQK